MSSKTRQEGLNLVNDPPIDIDVGGEGIVDGDSEVGFSLSDNFVFDIRNLVVGGADWSEVDHRISSEFIGRDDKFSFASWEGSSASSSVGSKLS